MVTPQPLALADHVANDLFEKVSAGVSQHGFAVEFVQLQPPRTGIFDGLSIQLDPDLDPTLRCFVLLHLFGHCVQWCAPSLSAVVAAVQNAPHKDAFLEALRRYEFQAGRLALSLLRQVAGHEHDRWFSDFVHTDQWYLERFYREGKLARLEDCVVLDRPMIESETIPPIERRKIEVRFAF